MVPSIAYWMPVTRLYSFGYILHKTVAQLMLSITTTARSNFRPLAIICCGLEAVESRRLNRRRGERFGKEPLSTTLSHFILLSILGCTLRPKTCHNRQF